MALNDINVQTLKKPFNIVFEGPKGIGKSTIIKKTKETLEAQGLKVDVTHLTKETGGDLDFLLELLNGASWAPTCDVRIFDRLHISEVAYTEATPNRLSRFNKEDLKSITAKVDYTVLLLATNSDVLLERILTRDGFISNLDKSILKDTVIAFRNIEQKHDYLLSKEHSIIYGYDQPEVNKYSDDIVKILKSRVLSDNEK